MTLFSKTIPTLIGGVSQQSPGLQFPGQVTESINSFLSLVEGAAKRPPTAHVAQIVTSAQANSSFHLIERDGDDFILVLSDVGPDITTPGIQIFDMQGVAQPLLTPFLQADHLIPTHYTGNAPGNYLGDWEQPGIANGWVSPGGTDAALAVVSTVDNPLVAEGFTSKAIEISNIDESADGTFTHEVSAHFGSKSASISIHTKKKDGIAAFELIVSDVTAFVVHTATFGWNGAGALLVIGAPVTGVASTIDLGNGWWKAVYILDVSAEATISVGNALGAARLDMVADVINPGRADYYWGMQVAFNDDAAVTTPPPVDNQFGPFRYLTIADSTFVLNTAWKTRLAGLAAQSRADFLANDVPAAPVDIAFVSIQQVPGLTNYKVTLTNSAGSFTATTQSTTGSALNTDVLAGSLATQINLMDASITTLVIGSIIEVYSTLTITAFEVTDGAGDTVSVGFQDEVTFITELPLTFRNGWRIKVNPDPTDTKEDYYIKAVTDDGGATGEVHWVESTDWEVLQSMDSGSMPHELKYLLDDESGTATGTPFAVYFTFGPTAWIDREIGNDELNPAPTFKDRAISDIFFHANRLGLLSDQNLIMSEAGVFFNFWSTTSLTIPDADYIDIAVNEPKLAVLRAATSLDEALIVTSSHAQFVLDGSPLTPQLAILNKTTNFRVSNLKPVSSGRSIIYPTFGAEFSGVQDFFRTERGAFTSEEVTQPIPKYIEGQVQFTASYPKENILFLKATEGRTLYAYKFGWVAEQRIQSAWSKWQFGAGAIVRHLDFVEEIGVLLIERDGGLYLETIQVGDGLSDVGVSFQVMLDRRVDETTSPAVYSSIDDKTVITVPYNHDTTLTVTDIAVVTKAGVELIVDSIGTNTITVVGDHSSTSFWAGERYTHSLTLTEPVPQRDGPTGPIPISGRYTAMGIELQVEETGYFRAEVSPPNFGSTFVHEFTPQFINTLGVNYGELDLFSGTRVFGVMSPAKGLQVKLINDSPLPSRFTGLTWKGDVANYQAAW